MILGTGTDLVEIDRMRKAVLRSGQKFLDRLFTKEEQGYCLRYKDPAPHFAARFAAKEAVAKALGVGFGQRLSFLDVEIKRLSSGKPEVQLAPAKALQFPGKLHLSLSHGQGLALAFVVREKD